MEKAGSDTAALANDDARPYPTEPEAQRAWVEESIACRLADLKAKVERNKR